MSIVVTEAGFAPDDWVEGTILSFEALAAGAGLPAAGHGLGVDFPNDRDPAELTPWIDRLELVRVAFPAMADGRGFSIARRLRAMGYRGRLRAKGPLIADQLRAARQVGFDEIELPEDVAARQPAPVWRRKPRGSYQDRLLRRD